jgi:hypothetical protein
MNEQISSRLFPLKPIDARGQRIRTGDIVRVIGVPDLNTMDKSARLESEPAFLHLRGTCKQVQGFNPYGFAVYSFAFVLALTRGHTSFPSSLRCYSVRSKRSPDCRLDKRRKERSTPV